MQLLHEKIDLHIQWNKLHTTHYTHQPILPPHPLRKLDTPFPKHSRRREYLESVLSVLIDSRELLLEGTADISCIRYRCCCWRSLRWRRRSLAAYSCRSWSLCREPIRRIQVHRVRWMPPWIHCCSYRTTQWVRCKRIAWGSLSLSYELSWGGGRRRDKK